MPFKLVVTYVSYSFDLFQKMVKVQIREDLTQESLPHLASSTFGNLAPGPEPSISHLTKPITKPPSTKVEIRSKTVIFPPTEPGKTSGIVSQSSVSQMSAAAYSLVLCF